MSDGADTMIVHLLGKIDERLDRMADDLHDVKARLISVGGNMGVINRRVDRTGDSLDLIEVRLGQLEV
jgi:hypothetical protein